MTKEKFVSVINKLKDASRLEDNISNLLSTYNDKYGDMVDNYGLVLTHEFTVVDLLSELMNDQYDNISYFCYELDFGEKYEPGMVKDDDGNEIDFSCAESLYDFLVSCNE